MRIAVIFVLIMVSLFAATGCTTTQKGMTIGALGGAGAGAAIGYFGHKEDKSEAAVTGALIGAATGAVAGAIIGYFAGE